jgi:pimeloyl-ACP methyl ester carboxylesterase
VVAVSLGLGGAVVLALAITASWAIWERNRDPLRALDIGASRLGDVEEQVYPEVTATGELRVYHDVVMATDKIGEIRFTVSRPSDDHENLPVVIILGGLEIGRESLAYVQEHGPNALISYEYPYSPDYWYEGTPLGEIPAIRRAVLAVPAQLAMVLEWVLEQPWCDRGRVSVLGYSFGALFSPAFHRLAEARGLPLQKGILAYGGVDCELLLMENLGFGSNWQRAIVAWLAATAIRPIEPALHVPYLHQEMLLINGKHDTLVPPASFTRLHGLKPDPKEVILLEAGHMHPRKPDLTAKLVAMSRDWLLQRDLIAVSPGESGRP